MPITDAQSGIASLSQGNCYKHDERRKYGCQFDDDFSHFLLLSKKLSTSSAF